MYKIWLVVLCLTLPLSLKAEEKKPEFQEGVHYKVLDRPFKKNHITKVYSVYCSACFVYERVLEGIFKNLKSKNIEIAEIHVTGNGKFLEAPSKILAMVTDKDYEKAKKLMFEAIQQKGIRSFAEFLSTILPKLGLDEETYKAKAKDGKVVVKVADWEKEGVPLSRLMGIPVILINNRYFIVVKNMKTVSQLNRLINFLLNSNEKGLVAEDDQSNNGKQQ